MLQRIVSIISIFVLFANLNVAIAQNKDFLKVIDTVQGVDSYYTLDAELELDKVRLVLISPDKSKDSLPIVRHLGSISNRYLNEVGEYKLVLGYKFGSQMKMLDSQSFKVTETSLSQFGKGGDTVWLQSEDRFEIVDAPAKVVPLTPFSLTVKALNQAGELDPTYSGTIKFHSSDDNAQLPDDYIFMGADAGVKRFENAFIVTEAGQISIVVEDIANGNLIGGIDLTSEFVAQALNNPGELLEVTTPIAGVSTANQITFSGKVDPGLEVRISDDGLQLVKTNANAEGNFQVLSPVLADGMYKFVIETDTAKSNEIEVQINTAKAQLSLATVDNGEVFASAEVELNLFFDEEIDTVSAIVNGVRTPIPNLAGDKKRFRGKFVAPGEPGEYPVNLDVNTVLGVRSELQAVVKFKVLAGRGSAASGSTDGLSLFVPSKVMNLKAQVEDRKVVLNWSPATAEHEIDFYRIFYGTSPDSLIFSVDTNDTQTAWFVADLENGVRYYFRVFGVDKQGNQGDQGSDIISAIPGVAGSTSMHGADGKALIGKTSETGPALYFAILISLSGGLIMRRI